MKALMNGLSQRCRRRIFIGDYVISGGELPAMVLIDAAAFVPNALGDADSAHKIH
jgi:tRNA (guanine37-N1)-methyltransferase